MTARPLHPWRCTACAHHGLTTVSVHDVTGEAAKQVRDTGHAIHFSGVAEGVL